MILTRQLGLDRADLTTASGRLKAIWPMMEFAMLARLGHRPTLRAADGSAIRTLENLAKSIAQQCGRSRATIWVWYQKAQRRHGYEALADRPRADKGRSRFFLAHPKAAAFVRRRRRLLTRAIVKAVRRDWKGKQPSYGALVNYIKSLRAAAHAAARQRYKSRRERGA